MALRITKRKVKLQFISNNAIRNATFKKRRKGLMKKLDEITTLCGIEACIIIYNPYHDLEPDVWPSPRGVQRVMTRFMRMAQVDQGKKMFDQESFLKQKIMKAKEKLKKLRVENREKEINRFIFQWLADGQIPENLSFIDLNDMAFMIDQHLREIDQKIKALNNDEAQQNKEKVDDDVNVDAVPKQFLFLDLTNGGVGSGDKMDTSGDVNP